MTNLELESCVTEYGKDIFSFCIHLTGNRQEAEELYQDTFLKAVERRDTIRMDQNPKSYLLAVAVCLWKNKKRKYAWRNRIAPMESITASDENVGDRQENSCGQNPEESLVTIEEASMVRQAVNHLKEKQRVVVLLYYMEEQSMEAIAGILKLPVGTVKSRLHKARELLKKELEVVLDEEKS